MSMANLANSIRSVFRGLTGAGAVGTGVSWDTVQSVDGTGRCTVDGHAVPVTGLATAVVGERVPVARKDGRPVSVIAHRCRRAQFHPSRRVDVNGIVEELLVGNFDQLGATVWYRNHTTLAKVTDRTGQSIATLCSGHVPLVVKWGLDGNSFAVQCADGWYATFTLDRAAPDTIDPASPGNATRTYLGQPLLSTTPLATVTVETSLTHSFLQWIGRYEFDILYLAGLGYGDVWIWLSYWANLLTGWKGAAGTGSATATSTGTKAFPLNAVLAGTVTDANGESRCTGSVLDWFLDANGHLQFLLNVAWDYFAITTSGTGTATLHFPVGYGTHGMSGQDVAITVSPALEVLGAKRQSDQATVDEQHVYLFDAQTGSITWGTAAAAALTGHRSYTVEAEILEYHRESDAGYT